MLHFHIVTLFPESIEPYLASSIIGKAQEKKKIKISFYDPKDFTRDKYGRVDRRPYGGGPGMVLEPDAMLRAAGSALKKASRRKQQREPLLTSLKARAQAGAQARGAQARVPLDTSVIFFATDGAQFDEAMAQRLSKKRDIVLICGHYEGIDARVQKILKAKKVSMGPYVLTGGELPAATLIDAVARFVPGVLGKAESLERSRVSSPEVYTRPEVFEWKGKKHRVPKVLLSGNHAEIEKWKQSTRED